MELRRHLSVSVNFRNRFLAVVAGLACLLPAMARGQAGFTGLYYSFPAGLNGPGEMPQVSNANPNFASLAALQASLGPLTPASVTPTPYLNLNVTGNTNTLSFPTSVSANTYQYFEGYYSGMMLVSSTGAGTYNFGLGSDDGSMLWVDGQQVINNNNFQGFGTYPQIQNTVALNSGYHNVVVGYYQGTGNYALEAGVGGPDTGGTLLDLGTTANSSLQFVPDLVASSAQISAASAIDPGALGYANLIVGADNLSSTFTGSLAYSNTAMGAVAGILKLGTGQVSVTGNVSYGGATTVAAGTYWVKTVAQLPGYTSTGQVIVNGGVLAVGAGDGVTTGWNQAQIATMVSNATWNGGALGIDTTTGTFEYDSVIAGPSALTKLGPNSLILTAANNYSGNTTISAGTLQLGTGAAGLDGSVAGNVVNNGTLVYNLNGSQTAVGAISGKGGLIKTGPGMLTLGNLNTYAGPTIVSGGVLQIGAGSAPIPSSAGLVDYYPLANNANDLVGGANGRVSSAAVSFSSGGGPVNGLGYVSMPGDGSSNINMGALPAFGANFQSPVTISGWIEMTKVPPGTFQSNSFGFVNPNANGSVNSTKSTQFYFDNSNGPVFTEYYDDSAALASNPNSLNLWQYVTASWNGNPSSPVQIYLNGNLNTTLSSNANNGGTIINNLFGIGVRNSNWQGNVSNVAVYNQALTSSQVSSLYNFYQNEGANNSGAYYNGALPDSTALSIGGSTGATVDLNGSNVQVGAFSDNGIYTNGAVINSSGNNAILSVAPSGMSTFTGSIGGGVGQIGFVMNGSGTQVLAGSNTYSGGTTIAGGNLAFANSNALPSSGLISFTGGTLLAVNSVDLSPNFSDSANQAYSINTAGNNVTWATGLSSQGGSLTKKGAGMLTLTANNSFVGNNNYSGLTTVSSGTLQLVDGGSVTGSIVNNSVLALNFNSPEVFSNTVSGAGSLIKTGSGTVLINPTAVSSYSGPTIIAGGTLQLPAGGLAVPTTGLVDYYPFNGNLNDSVGTSNGVTTGTGGGVVVTAGGGRMPGAGTVFLPGTGGGVSMGTLSAFPTTFQLPVTISAWVQMTSSPSSFSSNVFGFLSPNASSSPSGGKSNRFYFDNNGSGIVLTEFYNDGAVAVPDGDRNWHLLTATWDGLTSDAAQIYVDGNLSSTLASNVNMGTTIYNGFGINIGNTSFKGYESDLRVYNVALSPAQVTTLYQAGLAANPLPTNSAMLIGSAPGPSTPTLDLNGTVQEFAGISDNAPYTNGLVINSNTASVSVLTLSPPSGSTASFSGTIAGGGALGTINVVVGGPGTQVLAGTNTYTGSTTVTGGTLQLGTGAIGGDAVMPISGIANNAGLVYNVASSQLANYPITGNGTLTKTGNGTLQLGTAASVAPSQSVNVSAGTMALLGAAQLASNNITIQPGGVLDSTAASGPFTLGAGQTLTAGRPAAPAIDLNGNVTVSGGVVNVGVGIGAGTIATLTQANGTFALAGGTVDYDLSSTTANTPGTSSLIDVSNLSLSGTTVLNFTVYSASHGLANGMYPLIDNTGTLSGSASNVAISFTNLATNGTRQSISPVIVGSSLDLQVIGNPANLTWTGSSGNGLWDVATSPNWSSSGPVSGNPNEFYNNDNVTFPQNALSGNITLTNSALAPTSITFSNGSLPYTLSGSGSITGSTSLLLTSSAGTVFLANPSGNTFTGPTTINGGSLVLGSANAVVNSPLTVNVDGGLAFASSGTYNLAQLNGSGALSLSGSNGPATLNVGSNNGNMTYSGAISGGGGLHLIGAGSMLLSAANTFTGATTINSGVLQLGNSGAVQNSTVVLNVNSGLVFSAGIGTFNLGGLSSAATLNLADVSSAPVTLNVGSDNQSTTFSGALSGSGSLVKAGNGLLALSGSNIAYTGNTTVSGGTLQFNDAINFSHGNVPSNTFSIASGAMLSFNTDAGVGTVTDGTITQVLGAMNGAGTIISGSGTFQKTGAGVLASGQGTGGTFLTMNLAAGALIDIEGGTLRNGGYGSTAWTNNQASMYLAAGASLDLWDGQTVYVDALNGAGSVTKQQGTGNVTLTVGVAGGSGTFSGTIQNPQTSIFGNNVTGSTVSFVKNGAGTQALTGANTYNGPTTVNGGVLQVSGGGSIVNSPVTVNSGAALQVIGGGSVSSSITINAGAVQIGTGAAGNDGTVTSATINNNGSLVYNLYGSQTYSGLIQGSGSVLKSGPGTLTLAGGNLYSGPTVIQGGVLQLSSGNTSPLTAMPGLSSLVDYYPFAGNANDIAGNIPGSASVGAANGTVTGNVVISAAGGRFGTGGVYMPGDGSSNINMGALPAFASNFQSPVTISGWIEMTKIPPGGFQSNEFGFYNPNANGGVNSTKSTCFYFDNNGGPVLTEFYDDSNTLATNANSLNVWQYVTATWDGNPGDNAQIYLNGNLNTTLSSSANNGGTVIYNMFGLGIGGRANWQGTESDVAVFNTNLTASQVSQLYSFQPLGAAQLPTNSVVELGGPIASTLDLDGVSQQIGGLEDNVGYTNGVVINSASSAPVVLTIGATGAETFSGMIEGGGTLGAISLVLSGTGELVLAGVNTFAGGTMVESGTLVLASPTALLTGSSLAVGNGASSLFAPATAGPAIAAGPASAAAVPEPGTLALAAIAAALLSVAAWRRRRS